MISRKTSGLLGFISALLGTILVVGTGLWLELPGVVILFLAGIMGLVLVLTGINCWRGARPRAQAYDTFESNSLGEPVTEEFRAPHANDPPLYHDEKPLCAAAPVLEVLGSWRQLFRGGITTILGKAQVWDAANAMVLTNHRLLLLMIGPGDLRRFSPSPKVTRLLEALPGEAEAKRRMLWMRGGEEVRAALEAMLAPGDLASLRAGRFSYSLPLADIQAWEPLPGGQSLKFTTAQGVLKYSLRHRDQYDLLATRLAGLLPPKEGGGP